MIKLFLKCLLLMLKNIVRLRHLIIQYQIFLVSKIFIMEEVINSDDWHPHNTSKFKEFSIDGFKADDKAVGVSDGINR